eukprot:CAMPEP_0198213602 /NCGR_PEP_ID=MMETSP1445-20131203/28962_1 /TAXON_ID=36898 /ORGANISM="Pyramimonas sp., Strain CCMP2087" /LENGTH=137 /DNA_ID=CAMNT_0043888269 /DNA_START=134 /DNA_END=547 /DNA_ORIENTATION=-
MALLQSTQKFSAPQLDRSVLPCRAARERFRGPARSLRNVQVEVVGTNQNNVVEVCRSKSCLRKGGRKVKAYFEELCPEGVTIEDRYCFIECAIGPNIGLNVDDMTINGVKTKADVAKILEERCPGGDGLMAKVAAEE